MKAVLLLLVMASIASAHFSLQYPDGLGGSDELSNENVAPCGGFIVSFGKSLPNFSVTGDWVGINNFHAESLFRYRVAFEDNKTWIDLNPTVHEVGIGKLCIKTGPAPANFTGKKGVLQVVGDGHGGALFQCAPVMFVNASAVSPTADQCSNGTGITAEFNTTVEFAVPSVPYNITAVDPNASPSHSAGTSASDAMQIKGVTTTLLCIVIACIIVGVFS